MFVAISTVFKGILKIGFDHTISLEIHLVRDLALAMIGAYKLLNSTRHD